METERERQMDRKAGTETDRGRAQQATQKKRGGWRNKTERKTGGKDEGNTERQRDTEKQTDGFVSLLE